MRKYLSPSIGLLLLIVLCPFYLAAQQVMVTGRVIDSAAHPVEGASITIKGTSTGTVSGTDGRYSIKAKKGEVLQFSYAGMSPQERPIGNSSVINITLGENAAAASLDEVVVTGYMTQRKADLTGAISVVPQEELNKNHGVTNVLDALQGVVPGMHITTDGNPASSNIGVQIRGLTSINGASPLIVIDGMPSTSLNLRDIDPNNIASFQVLKDAASASIYGAQGAAGVILIETKKGVVGKTRITYSGSYGFADQMKKEPMMNTIQYGTALWQAAVNDGVDPAIATRIYNYDWNGDYTHPVLNKVTPVQYLNADSTMQASNTNWLDAISQLGVQNNQDITISGGTDRSSSLLALNFFQNNGTQIYTGYKRYSARMNSSYKVIGNHLVVGENVEVSALKINDQNVMHDALVEPPIIPVKTADGQWGGSAVALGMDDFWNPVRELTLNKDNGNNYKKVVGDVFANVNFLQHFTFHTQAGLIYTEGDHRTIQFTFQEAGGKFNPISSVDQWNWQEATVDWTNTLDYKLTKGKHNLDAIAGMEAQKYTTTTSDATRQDVQFQNYNYAYLSTATGNISVTGNGDAFNTVSYFGKANYSFNNKYLLSASIRDDGSSKFGANNRFGLFPAASAGWRLSQEDFLKNSKTISDLKLRVSWGRNGNSNIPTGSTQTYYLADYNFTSYAISGQKTGSLPSGYYKAHTGNPDLKWETTTQTNIGVDFGLFDQRLSGSLDVYRKNTYGMLYQPPYLGTLGEGAYEWYNAADMTNKGIELDLAYHSDPHQKFTWTVRGNIAHNQNVINSLPQSVLYTYGGSALKGDNIQGHPLDSYYGFITQGLFRSQDEVNNSATQQGKGIGRIRYQDLSGPGGKPDGSVDYNYDQTWIGSWDPKVEYGLSFSANYKNFDFSMFWQGVAGSVVDDGWKSYSDFWNVWVQSGFNHPTRILGAYSQQNPNSSIPALSLSNANDELRTSTYFMEPGGYLKMRNIQIGYSIPHRIASGIGMEHCHVYIMGENLINLKNKKFTGPDPETPDGSSYSNPYTRPQVFKVGADLSF